MCSGFGYSIAELAVDQPFAVFVAGGEIVVDDFEACGEQEGEGAQDSRCALIEAAFG